MKCYITVFVTALILGLCMGVSCEGPRDRPQQSEGAAPTSRDERANTGAMHVSFNRRDTPPRLQSERDGAATQHLSAAHALQSPPPGTSSLKLTMAELAAELRLNEEQDPAKQAELEAEILKLREQRQSLYDPVVED